MSELFFRLRCAPHTCLKRSDITSASVPRVLPSCQPVIVNTSATLDEYDAKAFSCAVKSYGRHLSHRCDAFQLDVLQAKFNNKLQLQESGGHTR